MNVRICEVGKLSSWIRCMVSVTSYIMLCHSLYVESSSQLNKEDSHVSRVEAKLRCHFHLLFCSQIKIEKIENQHPTNHKNHMVSPPHNLKTKQRPERVSIKTTHPTPVESVSRGKRVFLPPRKRTMFFSRDRPKPLGCVSRKMVSLRECFWDGEVYVNISCQRVWVCKSMIIICKIFFRS